MEVMGIKAEELLDGVKIGGVATYLERAEQANINLFIWNSVPESEKKRLAFANLFLVAGARLERTTFGLWAQRATTAPPRNLGQYFLYCECKGSVYFL